MGSFVSMLGFGPNNALTEAKGTNILAPVSVDQAGASYGSAQDALSQNRALVQALASQGGIQNQSNVFNQQQMLANALMAQAQGQGPNPALAALNNATGQNAAQTAALMASSRGANANAGLIARQAGQLGMQAQQDAAGQSAVMQAQQQLAAQQALQNQQAQMANLATQQVGQQAAATSNQNQFAQGLQQALLNSIGQQNNANVGMQSNMNSANLGLAGINANNSTKFIGGLINSGASALGAPTPAGAFHGGLVNEGGVKPPPTAKETFDKPTRRSMRDVQEIYYPRTMTFEEGGVVPGKAKVAGDSPKNDVVKAFLSPDEIVLPRTVTLAPDAPEKARDFVAALQKKYGKGEEEEEFRSALKKAISTRKSK